LSEDLAATKFATKKLLSYRTKDGDLLVAFQLKPNLKAGSVRPCDYLIMVDTSASQVGAPLLNARFFTEEIIKEAKPEDRIALWTVNIPKATKDLSRGFQSAKSDRLKDALRELQLQVPLGDTDLPSGIEQAAKSFQYDPGRERAIVFLGDGMSLHNPMSADLRLKLSDEMVKNEIAFFPVPMGPRLDAQNLHGLASGTGGLAIRILPKDKPADTLKRLHEALAAPVLYPSSYQLSGSEVLDSFPTRLPPLRGDAPTLLVARLKAGNELLCSVEGRVSGQDVRTEAKEPVPPVEMDNFFLVGMFEQWKNAKDRPALLQADRALAYAHDANEFARAEFLAQAYEALSQDKMEAASKLFRQAKELDPSSAEAEGGLQLVKKLREGKVTKEQLRQQFSAQDRKESQSEKTNRLLAQADEKKADEKPKAVEKGPAPMLIEKEPPSDIREMQRRRELAQQIEGQRTTRAVEDAINEARRSLQQDPESARDLLKRVLTNLRENFDITDAVRRDLGSRLESTLRFVELEGARVQRDLANRLRLQAVAEERAQRVNQQTSFEEATQVRMLRFVEMMRTARFEDARAQSQAIRQDAIDRGEPVPPAVTAAWDTSLFALHLREMQRLRYLREDRYLATMMQVELSHIPFPDEPPIKFPDTAKWREITRLRKDSGRYESMGLAEEDPLTLKKIDDLKKKLNSPVSVDLEQMALKDALSYLQERYNIPLIVDEEAFKSDLQVQDIKGQQVKLEKVAGISLGTVLRLLLSQVNGTYIIRREYIEITTNQRQVAEKALRAYPVADLVYPIPNAINQAAVNQTLMNSILGGGFSPFGGAAFGGVGYLGGLGALGIGGLGALGALGGLGALGVGGLGALGLGGGLGALGAAGGGLGAVGLAGGQVLGAGGPQNLGVGGGGFVGFAGFGGQLGQLGNLGGQFGLQGGDQSQILITLIRQVIGTPADWSPLGVFQRPQVGAAVAVGATVEDEPAGDPNTSGALGYYPPARALVVKGTSRIHTRAGGGLLGRPGGPPAGGMGALDKAKKDFLASGKNMDRNPLDKLKDGAVAKTENKGGGSDAKTVAVSDLDAKTIWQEALAKGIRDPGLIIAVTDFLAQRGKFDHVAEFLKANLRQGIVVRPWVYEALAIALKESKGSIDDIERAQLSLIDIEPQDAQGYLRAAQAMKEAKRWDRAVAFCRQASILEPNSPFPYQEALLIADVSQDREAMEWAAGNLVSRDWPAESQELHQQAKEKMKGLAQVLRRRHQDDAERMVANVDRLNERDLVIHLSWQGDADLDLEVKEPIGTLCSFIQRQTPGGGILIGDNLADLTRETYTAAQAFPGEYHITVRRIWGRPLGAKATLKIIEHQGTARQTIRQETVAFDDSYTLKFNLKDGRRTSVARVPPPSVAPRPKTTMANAAKGGDQVLNKLRALANPDLDVNTGMRGGMVATNARVEPPMPRTATLSTGNQLTYQVPVAPAGGNSLDLSAQVIMSPDRKSIQGVKLMPIFETIGKISSSPVVNTPVIPGGGEFGNP
jgi:tetratricopeptide (TPR) repeat protein